MEQLRDDHLIASEDLLEWTSNPVTQAYFKEVNTKIKEAVLYLADGHCLNKDSVDSTAQETSRMIGRIEALREVLDIELAKD